MRVSVICTVMNEGESVRGLLDSLAAQTRPADEIVIVDGGSSDDTVAIIAQYSGLLPLRTEIVPGANISQGRNRAIELATGDIIAATDAGVWLEPQWLEALLEGFGTGNRPQVVAGFFVADPHTPFEVAMGATVLPDVSDIDPGRFLPSSRSVAFSKTAWQNAGGYPEWLDYCEDLVFDLNLRRVSGAFGWAPRAIAHFRPRGSMRAFFKQYYRYARGDGKADLWRRRHLIRYATYLLALPVLTWTGARHTRLAWAALLAGGSAYCLAPYRRLSRYLPMMGTAEWLKAVLLVPVIRFVGDVAKMLGYPAGVLWRHRHGRPSAN